MNNIRNFNERSPPIKISNNGNILFLIFGAIPNNKHLFLDIDIEQFLESDCEV